MLKKVLLITGAVILLSIAIAVTWIGPRFIIGILTYGQQAREGSLQVGDPAPLVSLVDLDGTTTRELSEWIGPRPVVLVFGSFRPKLSQSLPHRGSGSRREMSVIST